MRVRGVEEGIVVESVMVLFWGQIVRFLGWSGGFGVNEMIFE